MQHHKVLLSLFHFNSHWGGEGILSSHRHCAETLVPFLNWIEKHSSRRVSLEMSASGLLFLHQHYPATLTLLGHLIAKCQIEMICSQLTPAFWPAFPASDLLYSFHKARDVARSLNIETSGAFFSQEAFFGTGLKVLAGTASYLICKDDYLEYVIGEGGRRLVPIFHYHGLPVVVGSNHLLNEACKWSHRGHRISNRYANHLERAAEHNAKKSFVAEQGVLGDIQWQWLHCGDGNHWSTIHTPADLAHCSYDPDWAGINESIVDSYLDQGFEMLTLHSFVGRVASMVEIKDASSIHLVEGAWNPEHGRGIARWQGFQTREWEDADGILTRISRIRSRIIHWTRQVHTDLLTTPDERQDLDNAWFGLMSSQISDWLGWNPAPISVMNGTLTCNQLMAQVTQQMIRWKRLDYRYVKLPPANNAAPFALPQIETIGDQTTLRVSQQHGTSATVYVDSSHDCQTVGIRVLIDGPGIAYSPSGCDRELVHISWSQIREPLYLPCANGLLQVAETLFLIKVLATVHVAAKVCPTSRTVSFCIEGRPSGRIFTWEFVVFAGTPDSAVRLANEINDVEVLFPDVVPFNQWETLKRCLEPRTGQLPNT